MPPDSASVTRRDVSSLGHHGKSQHRMNGSQTLIRGLDVLEAVSLGARSLADLVNVLGLHRSTVYRIAATLVQRRYLSWMPGIGYALGPKALEIGYQARTQLNIPLLARKELEKLAAETEDTVHLGILDGTRAIYLDKISGRRRVDISSRVGERQPLRSTGLGKALLLDEDEARLREFYQSEDGSGNSFALSEAVWIERMRDYSRRGIAFDFEESEDRIRCVAAPVRDVTGRISAAISVSSAAHYMNDRRMSSLAAQVLLAAKSISRELGWEEVRNS
jgi:DNA-binding IclR family transcriptional regulator